MDITVGQWVRFIKPEEGYEYDEQALVGLCSQVEAIDDEYDAGPEVYLSFPSMTSWFYVWQVEFITEEEAMLWKLSK